MEKKYVVRYQGGSGGFLVAWLLQMSINSDCYNDSLQCFHHSLKNDALQWKNYEITPPNIGMLCNSFLPDKVVENEEEAVFLVNSLLNKIINNDTRIDSSWTMKHAIKAYLNNELYKKMHSEFDNAKVAIPNIELLEKVKEYNKLLFTSSKNLLVTAPKQFIVLANNTKAGIFHGKVDYCGIDPDKGYKFNSTYITPILNKHKDRLSLFPIESIWEGGWQEHLEKFTGKELTPHQKHRCLTIISRWLEIQPVEIKKFLRIYGDSDD